MFRIDDAEEIAINIHWYRNFRKPAAVIYNVAVILRCVCNNFGLSCFGNGTYYSLALTNFYRI